MNEALAKYEKARDDYEKALKHYRDIENRRMAAWNQKGGFGAVEFEGCCGGERRTPAYIECEQTVKEKYIARDIAEEAERLMSLAYKEALLYAVAQPPSSSRADLPF